jgi:hypothetical protein
MRCFAVCLLTAAGLAAPPEALRPELAQVKNVYLLPMAQGLDQYLANHLNRRGIYQIVADPAMADAVFTEQLGRDFEHRFNELYPSPEKLAKEKEAKEAREKDKDKDKDKDEKPGDDSAETSLKDQMVMRSSSFSRGRGNVFLVDVKSRRVVWSFHLRPQNSNPREINQTAEQIVERLDRDLKGK